MTDKVSAAVRSKIMATVRAKDTKPEKAVRTALFAAGYRYRLHRRDLPGRPDIVFPRFRVAVFVHGCFWHGHDCPRGRRPTSNVAFWTCKLDQNIARDAHSRQSLEDAGWTVVVIWQCQLDEGIRRLSAFLADSKAQAVDVPATIEFARKPAKKRASLGGTALPIIRATGSIWSSG